MEVLQSHSVGLGSDLLQGYAPGSDLLQASVGNQKNRHGSSVPLGVFEATRVLPPPPPPISLRAEVASEVEAPGGPISPIERRSSISATTAAALLQANETSQEPLGRSARAPVPVSMLHNSSAISEACSPHLSSLSTSCRWMSQRTSDDTMSSGNGVDAAHWESMLSATCSDDIGSLGMKPGGAQTAPIPGMPFLGSVSLPNCSSRTPSRTRPNTPVRGHTQMTATSTINAANGYPTSVSAGSSNRRPSPTPMVAGSTPAGSFRVGTEAPLQPQTPHGIESDPSSNAWCTRSAGQRGNGQPDWNTQYVGTATFDRTHLQASVHPGAWNGSMQVPARNACHGQQTMVSSVTATAHTFGSNQGATIGMVQRQGPVRTRSLSAAMRSGQQC